VNRDLSTKLEEQTALAETAKAELKESKEKAEKLEEELGKAKTEKHEANVSAFLAEAKSKGKVAPAEEEHLVKLAADDAGFETVKGLVNVRKDYSAVPLQEVVKDDGSNDDKSQKKITEEEAIKKAHALKEEKSISLTEALISVKAEYEVESDNATVSLYD